MSSFDFAAIQRVREQVRAALATTAEPLAVEALQASLQLFESLVTEPRSNLQAKYAGSMDHTFTDEDYAPYGREIDVRIFYNWEDYNRADEPYPVWGATIEAMQVQEVRYFNDDGEVVSLDEHLSDVAGHLLSQHDESLSEGCTEDGFRKGIGKAPGWYSLSPVSTPPLAKGTELYVRMASSLPTRKVEERHERLG
jgi:hypothetical protein